VRVIGNEAVHPGKLDLKDDRDTATRLFKLVNIIAEQMISNPKHVGWQTYRVETYVNWCGHGQEIIPFPLPDGRVTFVPVLGEAR